MKFNHTNCTECGKQIEQKHTLGNRTTCSDKCRKRRQIRLNRQDTAINVIFGELSTIETAIMKGDNLLARKTDIERIQYFAAKLAVQVEERLKSIRERKYSQVQT